MLRILPFRQYDENDVINLFALDGASANEATTDSGAGDAGVFVKVSAGDFDKDPVSYSDDSYLGKTDYPFIKAQYPKVNLECAPATSGEALLGITLRQTAKTDENGEKLLYHPVKAEELGCVLPGQAVPVATRGVFTITADAYDGALSVGGGIALGASGKVAACAATAAEKVGTVIGTGSRGSGTITDAYAGNYAVIALGL
tara:strand:- start:2254 stop:2856 length:603 start_codon:yes stop_codon:yes gene_type:complete